MKFARTYESGIVVPLPKFHCVEADGEDDSRVASRLGRCFVDEHHLYFTEEADLLEGLGVISRNVQAQQQRLVSDDIRDLVRIAYSPGGPRAFEERLEHGEAELTARLKRLRRLGIFPVRQLDHHPDIGRLVGAR